MAVVTTMHDHDAIVVMRMPVAMAMPDHDGFGTGDRRRRDGDGGERGNHNSDLLHLMSSSVKRKRNVTRDATFPPWSKSFLNGCSDCIPSATPWRMRRCGIIVT